MLDSSYLRYEEVTNHGDPVVVAWRMGWAHGRVWYELWDSYEVVFDDFRSDKAAFCGAFGWLLSLWEEASEGVESGEVGDLQLSLSRIKNSSVEKSAKKQLKIRNPIKVQRPRESGQLHRRVILSPTERVEANPFPETSRVAPHASALAEEIVEYSSGECKGYSSSNPSDQD